MRITREAWEDAMRVFHGESPTHTDLRDRLITITTLTVILDLIASVAILFLERHQHGTEITNFGDSVFWVTTQLLTVSSQIHNPFSTGARVIDVILEAWSIAIVATLAGSFAAFFHRRSREMHGPAVKKGDG
jgi:ABC-type phosphate/phosphonate transport system permease subunit